MSRRLLVVDDDRLMVHTLRDVLELSGWITEGAHNGAEAVLALRRGLFDCVLMDIRMPEMDGVAALKVIRRERPNTRVVLMTAFTAPELISEAEREGALRVLPKPVALPPLLELLKHALHEKSSVMIVDDEPAFLNTLADSLVHSGYPVIAARGLDEALEALKRQTPAAILLHLRLADISPDTAVLTLRQVSPAVGLILYSGQPAQLADSAERMPPGWIQARLQKPFAVERLTEILDDVIAAR